MSDSNALDSFVDKWRARWPEWSVAEVFVAPARRAHALAWFALLQEFEDALNIAGETLPADAKLAWWGEELRGWQQHRSRHPLGRVLEPVRADWAGLAEALPLLIEARAPATNAEAAHAQLVPYGEAVARVEAEVLGRAPSADLVVVQVLAQRLIEAHGVVTPNDIAGESDRARQIAWAGRLSAGWPRARDAAPERRLWADFARGRLRRFAAVGQDAPLPSRIRLLLAAWWQARGG